MTCRNRVIPLARALAMVWVLGAAALLAGCEITRVYQGSQLRADPNEWIINGQTTKGDVLRVFGPPDRIQRQLDGDIFTYSYMRRDSRRFRLQSPVVTNFQFLSYTRIDEKADRMVVLFDRMGVVSSFGYRRGTEELPAGVTGMRRSGGDRPPSLPRPQSAVDPALAPRLEPSAITATAVPTSGSR
jgi:hypothetical protein